MPVAPEKESENYAVSDHGKSEQTPQSGRPPLNRLQFSQIFFTNYSQQQWIHITQKITNYMSGLYAQ